MSLHRTPAKLEASTDAETSFGGAETVWTALATVWIDLIPAASRDIASSDGPPLRLETATARARDDARVRVGQRLTLATEPPWTVRAVDHGRPSPGRMTLTLERTP